MTSTIECPHTGISCDNLQADGNQPSSIWRSGHLAQCAAAIAFAQSKEKVNLDPAICPVDQVHTPALGDQFRTYTLETAEQATEAARKQAVLGGTK